MSVPGYTPTIDIATFIGAFLATYEGGISGDWARDVANQYDNSSMVGVYPLLESAVGMKLWTGARQFQKVQPLKLTLTSVPFEASTVYPADSFNADTVGIFQGNVNMLAEKAVYHKSWLLRDLLPTLTTVPSFDSLYDGSTVVPYFSALHPYGFDAVGVFIGGTQSNLHTKTDVTQLQVVSVAAPTTIEMANILMGVLLKMHTYVDMAGDPTNGEMRSLYVFTGDVAKWVAINQAANNQTLIASNGQSVQNPLNGFFDQGYKFKGILEPKLSGPDLYFARADGRVKPFIIQETSGIELQPLGPDSEYAKLNNEVFFGVKAVRQVGGFLYTSACKATLST